jgi:hypothetical protein
MRTFVNGLKVIDVTLNNRNDTNGRLVIQLSPRLIHPGRNWLHLAFNLHERGEDCNLRYLEEVWAEISAEDTLINLAHVTGDTPLDLHYLPGPLVEVNDLSNDVFVLPINPSTLDLTSMVRLAAKLGSYSSIISSAADSLRPHAITADDFDNLLKSGSLLRSNVIAIGDTETNSLVEHYNDWLPQPLAFVNGVIEPAGGRALLPEEMNGQSGYIQVLPAPWARRQALIVISAPSPKLLGVVNETPTLGRRLNVHGNVAVVEAGKVVGLSLGGPVSTPLTASARIAVLGIMIGDYAMVATIGWIFNHRKRRKEQESKYAIE